MTNNWIIHPTILKGSTIDLIPLEKGHFEDLYVAAADKEIWGLIPTDCSGKEKFYEAYITALAEREKGVQYPFVIYHKASKKFIGSTRLFEIYPKDSKLEIGWTWLTKDYWGSGINLECKYLLLQFCFDVLHTVRVQLKTDELNMRSRKAIEKIGGKFEGILRKERLKDNGLYRNAVYYSILDEEWEGVRVKLQSLLKNTK